MAGPEVTMPRSATHATVVGGGIVGALAAVALAKKGFAVQWFAPPEPAQREDGAQARAYAISPASMALLHSLGVTNQSLVGASQPVRRMEVFHLSPAARVDLAPPSSTDALATIVVHAQLLSVCEKLAKATAGVTRIETPLTLEEMDGLCAKANGLVVAADGARSMLRRRAGFLWSRRDYGQTAVVAAFATERPHEGVACQWFGADRSTHSQILALLPLAAPQQVSMVFSLHNETAQSLLSQSPSEISKHVCAASQQRFGALEMVSAPVPTPLVMTSLSQFVQGRMVLLGDAAHTVHPLAGYGLNLGLQDIQVLMQHLSGDDQRIPRELARYQRARTGSLRTVQWGLDGLHRLMSSNLPGVAGLRAWGMQALQALPALRAQMVAQAMSGGQRATV
jgi:ubiquinone biosynthesis UbiH/UbiF/VisC/COQ6 family hydroxylase